MSPGLVLHEDWCCSKHSRLISTDRSINSICWPLCLVTLVISDPRVSAKAGYNAETGAQGDARKLGPILAEIGPLCCYLTPELLAESYEAARHPKDFKTWQRGVYARAVAT